MVLLCVWGRGVCVWRRVVFVCVRERESVSVHGLICVHAWYVCLYVCGWREAEGKGELGWLLTTVMSRLIVLI